MLSKVSIHIKWVIGHQKLICANLFANLFMEQCRKNQKKTDALEVPGLVALIVSRLHRALALGTLGLWKITGRRYSKYLGVQLKLLIADLYTQK